MGYTNRTSITKRVDLSEGYWALIRMLRSDDEDALQAILFSAVKNRRAATDNEGTPHDYSWDLDAGGEAAYQRQLIVRGTAEWNLDSESGEILPINEHSVRLLTAADRNTLVAAIKDLSGKLDAKKEESTPAG